MKVLIYYSKGNNYKLVANALSLEDHEPVILWADNFKEALSDSKGDALYICEDVSEDKRERILQHFANTDIKWLEDIEEAEIAQSPGESSQSLQFETLEEVEAYISELQLELENAQEIRNAFLEADKQSAEQEQREEDARIAKEKAEQEAKEADDALAKAEKEKQEADEAAKAALEAEALANQGAQETETDTSSETAGDKYEHPTREQMILELRGLKDDGIEVPIPRNATLAQIKPLYDEHIRKINGDA